MLPIAIRLALIAAVTVVAWSLTAGPTGTGADQAGPAAVGYQQPCPSCWT